MNETFTGTVREVLREMGKDGREIVIQEAAEDPRLDLVFDADKRPLYNVMCDMMKSGEVERLRPGVYRYIGRLKSPEMQEIMWRVLRARKTVTVADMMELSGAAENYVKEWLQMLQRRKIVRHSSPVLGTWRLINDPGPDAPKNEEKAARLRRIRREKKKAALAAVDKVAGGVLAGGEMAELMRDAMDARASIIDIPD